MESGGRRIGRVAEKGDWIVGVAELTRGYYSDDLDRVYWRGYAQGTCVASDTGRQRAQAKGIGPALSGMV